MILAVLSLLLFLSFGNISPRTLAAENPTINEFFAHPSTGNKEWVEFYNPDKIDLAAYYLDDDLDFANDSGSSGKKSLSAISYSDTAYQTFDFESFLNNSGDFVVLFDSNGTIIDQYQYADDPGENVSVGRSPDGTGAYNILSSATKGLANSNPQPSPSPSVPQPSPSAPSPSTLTTSSSSKSPSPSPKIGGATLAKLPTPSPKTGEVLAAGSHAANPIAETNDSPSPSPTENQIKQNPAKIKIAAIMVGAGTIVIASSVGFLLWYKKALTKKEDPANDQIPKIYEP